MKSYPKKSLNPIDRLGVYKRLSDVPDRFRLYHHAEAYEERDVWQEFCEEYEYEQADYDRYEEEVDRVGDCWKTFMADQGRHHALAISDNVNQWCADLLESKSERRTHDYFLRVNRFYDWLKWHSEHPHVYNPVLMAPVTGEAARTVWGVKAAQNREQRRKYRRQSNE